MVMMHFRMYLIAIHSITSIIINFFFRFDSSMKHNGKVRATEKARFQKSTKICIDIFFASFFLRCDGSLIRRNLNRSYWIIFIVRRYIYISFAAIGYFCSFPSSVLFNELISHTCIYLYRIYISSGFFWPFFFLLYFQIRTLSIFPLSACVMEMWKNFRSVIFVLRHRKFVESFMRNFAFKSFEKTFWINTRKFRIGVSAVSM